MNLNEAKECVGMCLEARLTCFLHGSPGIGKSAIVKQLAKEYNLELIDYRLSTAAVEDIVGLPRFGSKRAEFVPFSHYPLEDDPLPEGKSGFLLFLDEMNSAPRSVAAAAYQIVLDRMVGQHKLHPRCAIVCAGNLKDDNAIVNDLGTAMQSRMVHIEVESDFKTWLNQVAIPQAYDPRLVSFLSIYSDRLMNFDPDHNEYTFACPRTWEFVNRLIKDREDISKLGELINGCVGVGIGSLFMQFIRAAKNLPDIKGICEGRITSHVPAGTTLDYATMSALYTKITKDNADNVITYIKTMDLPIQVLFLRLLVNGKGQLLTHPAINAITKELAKELV